MPLYEYKCANCGKKFEKIQKFSDAPLTMHEECGSGPVERLISVSALQFKGSGWYVNDYAKNGGPSKDQSSKEGKDSSSKEGKESSKDSKEKSGSESSKSESSSSESKSSDSGSKTESSKPAAPAPSTTSSEK